MTGTSYNGTLPLAAATTGVEGLEAIIPVAPNTSYYHYYRSNGLIRHPGGYMGEDIDVLYNFINSGNPEIREHCDCEVRDKEMVSNQDRASGDYNAFWAGRDYLNDLGPMKAALLMSHGFNDWNVMPEHSNRIYQAVRAKGLPCRIYYHQGGHGGPPPLEMMNRWFTRYLYGVDNGVEKEPHAYIVREDADPSEPTPYENYPHPEARMVTLHPAGDGTAIGKLDSAAPNRDLKIGRRCFTGGKISPRRNLRTDCCTRPIRWQNRCIFPEQSRQDQVGCNKPAANLSIAVGLPIAGVCEDYGQFDHAAGRSCKKPPFVDRASHWFRSVL
jgi:X-Pro dipeptidyl-peptidase